MQCRKPPLPALTVKLSKYNVDDVALGVCKTGAEEAGVTEVRTSLSENLPRFAWSTPQLQKLKFLPLRRYNLTLNLLSRSNDLIASGRQIAINGHIKFNLTIPLQQLNGLETLVIIMVANKYAFLQITRRRFLNEWEAFKKVISRRNIRRRRTIPLTLSNLKLLRRNTRTENILHRNFTRRQVAIQNRVASNIGISQSTFSVKVLNLFSRSRRKTNKRKSKHSAMLRNKETRHRMFIGLLNTTRKLA